MDFNNTMNDRNVLFVFVSYDIKKRDFFLLLVFCDSNDVIGIELIVQFRMFLNDIVVLL